MRRKTQKRKLLRRASLATCESGIKNWVKRMASKRIFIFHGLISRNPQESLRSRGKLFATASVLATLTAAPRKKFL